MLRCLSEERESTTDQAVAVRAADARVLGTFATRTCAMYQSMALFDRADALLDRVSSMYSAIANATASASTTGSGVDGVERVNDIESETQGQKRDVSRAVNRGENRGGENRGIAEKIKELKQLNKDAVQNADKLPPLKELLAQSRAKGSIKDEQAAKIFDSKKSTFL